ncbi:MAG: hypothetical protein IPN05_07185 [Sulfuritalea sp.]|nr:hypothetical protein [Sulfuritalea sp.]
MVAEPLPNLRGFPVQALDLSGVLLGQRRLHRQGIVLAVAGEHGPGSGFHLVGLAGKVGTGATAALAGIGRQLDAVDGEHLAADEPHAVADEQDFREQRPDLAVQGADEGGEGGEVRGAVAGKRDEGDVVLAGGFDVAELTMPRL